MKKRLCSLVFACLLCFEHQALAGVNGWTAIGPTGGQVNRLAFSEDGQSAFAIADGGYYRSQDGGVTWQLIESDFPNAPFDLALDPVDPTRVYLVIPNWPSLYISTDGGTTLAPAANLPTAVTQALQIVVSADGQTLYIVSGAKVFRSVDRAQSWQAPGALSTDPAARVIKLIIDPTDANSLYAIADTSGTVQEVMASHDGGTTWQALLASVTSSTSFAYDLAINAANPLQLWVARSDGVWTSGDRGLHWSNSTTTAATVIVEDPLDPAVLYAGTGYGQIYRTSDSGVTWSDVTGNLLAGRVFSIAINPSQHAQLLVGSAIGINGSSTSGSAWSPQQTGLISTYVDAFSADAAADRIYLEIPSGGIYYSEAGATTTAVNNAGLAQLSAPPTSFVLSAMLAQPGNIWASQDTGLTHSIDGGNSWLQIVPVTPTPPYQLFAMASAPSAPLTILAASISALYRSTDGGALWTHVTSGMPAGSISKLLMGTADPAVAYAYVGGATASPGVYKSTNAGMTWLPASGNAATEPDLLLSMDPTAANVLYGATDKALLRSMDSGATWSALAWDQAASLGYPSVLAVDPVRPQTLYASGGMRVARSVDGGASWETLRDSTALPAWSVPAMIVDPNRPANILVATFRAGVQQFTIAPDLALQASVPPDPVPIGVASTYAYTASNLGPFDATGVNVTLQLPSSAQNVSATTTGGSCTVSGTVVTCSAAILRTGSSMAIALNAAPPAAGTFSISGGVHGDQPDPDAQNNATATAINVAAVADLSVSGTGIATAHVGDSVSYSLIVKNDGPNSVAAASVSFQFASGLTPGAVTSTSGACSTVANLTTCTLSDLPPAGSVTITVSASAAIVGQQVSTAEISSTTTDPIGANNSTNLSTMVSGAPEPASQSGGGGGFSIWNLLMLALAFFARWYFAARTVSRNEQAF